MTTTRKLLRDLRKINKPASHWAVRRQAYRIARMTPIESDSLRQYIVDVLRRKP